MKRKEFIKSSIGLMGLTAFTPMLDGCSKKNDPVAGSSGSCVVSPGETSGPYPYDLSSNSAIFRKDITEGKTGLPLNLVLTLVDTNNNCAPIENARVDIWHCDKDGYYSEYNEPGFLGQKDYTGETFLRGIQLSDTKGIVNFTSIYPGWYSGRIAHIHIEVFINNVLKKTTQMAFPDAINEAVYKTTLYSSHGQNSSVNNNAADSVFGDSATDLEHELCVATANAATGGYDATLTVGLAL